jgi:hypothetical protein
VAEPLAASVVSKAVERSRKTSATKKKISATPKHHKREAVTVAENPKDLTVYVSDGDLLSDVRVGVVRVHKHGSGEYRGQYLALRPAGGRKDKRPMLATGRPERLKEYLSTLGVHLCVSCRAVALGCSCSQCGGK